MRKPRAIIYDDDVTVLNLLETYLSQKDYEVVMVNDPKVCLLYENKIERCDKVDPCADIFITDYEMPNMSGIELLQNQYKRGCQANIMNKAVMSGSMDKENRKKIEEMGCSFFQKPIDFKELSDWLDQCKQRLDLSKPLGKLE